MKRSDLWLTQRLVQDTRTNVANLTVLEKIGPNNLSEPSPQENKKGEKYFIAGKSVVGGEEVVG